MPLIDLDTRSSLRGLRRSPGLVITAVIALGMGIGFTTTMFSIPHGGTRDLPFDDPDDLVIVTQTFSRAGIPNLDTGPFVYREWVDRQQSFDGLAAFRTAGVNISGPGARPVRESGTFITANAFDLLGEAPRLGRAFTLDDARPGAQPVAIIGHDLWRDRYGEDPAVLGSTIRLDGTEHTIVGVMSPGFGFPVNTELWIPFTPDPTAAPAEGENLDIFGRLGPGVSIERASLEMQTITDRLAQDYPALDGRSARVFPFVEFEMDPAIARVLYLMVFAVSFVLIIACVNVANLLLARAATRTREVAIRTALGASRTRIIVSHLVESLVLATAGGLIGLAIAHVGVGFFARMSADILDAFWVDFRVDGTVVIFASLLTAAAAVLAGIMPALRASATSVSETLKDQGPGVSSLRIGRLGRSLVVVEVALACGLLVMTLVLTGSALQMRAFEFPFETRDVFTARIGLTGQHTADPDALATLLGDLHDRVAAIPGVRATAMTSALPGRGAGNWLIRLDNEPADATNRYTGVVSVTHDFFDVFGGTALRGRTLSPLDTRDSQPVAVVNESFVATHSADRDPIGRTVHISGRSFTIVGVVPDLAMQDPEDPNGHGIYVPVTQLSSSWIYVVARTAGAPLALTEPLFDAVATVDPDLPLVTIATLHDAIWADKRILDAVGTLFFVFGVGALLLTVIGLYGVVSFAVNQRRREIGIRVALGADTRHVLGMILGQGSRQLAIGLAIGLLLAYALSRLLAAGIEFVQPAGPLMLLAVVTCLALTAVVALVAPARRALSVQPAAVLRED